MWYWKPSLGFLLLSKNKGIIEKYPIVSSFSAQFSSLIREPKMWMRKPRCTSSQCLQDTRLAQSTSLALLFPLIYGSKHCDTCWQNGNFSWQPLQASGISSAKHRTIWATPSLLDGTFICLLNFEHMSSFVGCCILKHTFKWFTDLRPTCRCEY